MDDFTKRFINAKGRQAAINRGESNSQYNARTNEDPFVRRFIQSKLEKAKRDEEERRKERARKQREAQNQWNKVSRVSVPIKDKRISDEGQKFIDTAVGGQPLPGLIQQISGKTNMKPTVRATDWDKDANRIPDSIQRPEYRDSELVQHMTPEERFKVQEAIINSDTGYISNLSNDLYGRANPSNFQKGRNFGRSMVEGIISPFEKTGDSIQAITGWNDLSDRVKAIEEQRIARNQQIDQNLANGSITEEEAEYLKRVSRQQADLEAEDAAKDTEWAGMNGGRLRIAAGVALEGGATVAGLLATGGGYAAARGGAGAISTALRTGAQAGAEGFAYGVGNAMQGEDWTLDETTQKAITPAVTGLLAGAVLPAAGGTLARGSKNVAKSTGRAVMKSPVGNPIRKIPNPVRAIDNKIAPALRPATQAVRRQIDKIPGAKKTLDWMGSFVDDQNIVKKQFRGKKDRFGDDIPERLDDLKTGMMKSNSEAQANFAKEMGELIDDIQNSGWSTKKRIAYAKKINDKAVAKQTAINHNKIVEKTGKGKKVNVPKLTKKEQWTYDQYNKGSKNALRALYEAGELTPEEYAKYMADPDYIHIQRVVEDRLDKVYEGSGVNKSSKTLKQLKGDGGKEAVDPLASLFALYQRAYASKAVSEYKKYLINVTKDHGGKAKLLVSARDARIRREAIADLMQNNALKKKLVRVEKSQKGYVKGLQKELRALKKEGYKGIPEGQYKVVDLLLEMEEPGFKRLSKKISGRNKKLAEAMEELKVIRKDIEVSTDYNKAVREVIQKHSNDLETAGKPTLKIFREGLMDVYEIDEDAYRQLTHSNAALRKTIDTIMYPSHVLRFGATAGNPVFAASNIVRDQFTSFINSEDIFATHNPMSVARGLREAIAKPIGRNTIGRFVDEDSVVGNWMKPSKEFVKFLENNQNITRADLINKVKQTTKDIQRESGIRRKTPLGAWQEVIQSSELAGRYQNWVGTYKKVLSQGTGEAADYSKAIQAANRASAHNSINFALRGEQDAWLRIFNPYLNAGIQGSRQLARSFIDRPIGTALKVGTTIIGPSVALAQYNLMDPGRAEVYAEIASSRPDLLENNFVFIKNDGTIVTIPMPPGISKFANPFRNYVEAQYIGDRKGFLENAAEMMGGFSPVGTSKGEIMSTITPQAIQPILELENNRNLYFQDEIITEEMQDKPKEEQYYSSTPQIAKDLAGLFNTSPLAVMHLVRGYTAGFGTQAMGTIDQIRREDTGGQEPLSQLKKKFIKERPSGGVWGTFYEGGKGFKGYDELSSKLKNTDTSLAKLVRSNYNDPKVDQKAKEWNDSIQAEIDKAKNALQNEYGRYQTGEHKDSGKTTTEIQLTMLESLKYSFENGKLKNAEKYGLLNSRN